MTNNEKQQFTVKQLWQFYKDTTLLTHVKEPYIYSLDKEVWSLREELLFQSHIHGSGHIMRVMILAANIAQGLGLPSRETKLVIKAAAYHDIGRVNDKYDIYHGGRSAAMMPMDNFFTEREDALICAMMAAHSRPDDEMDETMGRILSSLKEEDIFLAKVLKDADGLDRVRINHLDPRFLRHTFSLKLIDYAHELFEKGKEMP